MKYYLDFKITAYVFRVPYDQTATCCNPRAKEKNSVQNGASVSVVTIGIRGSGVPSRLWGNDMSFGFSRGIIGAGSRSMQDESALGQELQFGLNLRCVKWRQGFLT